MKRTGNYRIVVYSPPQPTIFVYLEGCYWKYIRDIENCFVLLVFGLQHFVVVVVVVVGGGGGVVVGGGGLVRFGFMAYQPLLVK